MAIAAPHFLSTVLASGIAAFAAAGLGYRYAVAKFLKEQTFSKQLAWYEKATGLLIDAANKLNWALAADHARIPEAERSQAWAIAHSALLSLRGLEAEAEIMRAIRATKRFLKR